MCGTRWGNLAMCAGTLLAWCAVFLPTGRAEEFVLEESSVFGDADGTATDPQAAMMRYRAAQHRTVICQAAPLPDVVYPQRRSPNPLYGVLPSAIPGGTVLPFLLDESDPLIEETTQQDGAALMRHLADLLTGSAQTTVDKKRNYDLLYVDINADRDLTNDPPLRPAKEPPKMLVNMAPNQSLVVFDYLEISPSGADTTQARPIRFLPWLNTIRPNFSGFMPLPSQSSAAPMVGISQTRLILTPDTVHSGRIRIGDTWYQAVLGSSLGSSPSSLLVQPESPPESATTRSAQWRAIPLGRHQTAEGFYEVAINPSRDRITVEPYRGPMGEFRVEPGKRQVERFGASGMLQTATGSTVWIGEPGNYYSEERPRSCQLPTGDYGLSFLTLVCDDLLVSLSPYVQRAQIENAVATGASAFPIAIREEQSFSMRLGERPEMVFLRPSANSNEVFRRGTTVPIQALLVDPSLNCMIRGLNDTTNKLQERLYPTQDGEMRKVPVYASLVPQVSITNAAGKVVANGVMPFG